MDKALEDKKQEIVDLINNVEEEDFSDFYERVSEFIGNTEEEAPIVRPDSKINARDWVFAFVKAKEDIDFLKKEYIPVLTEKYITPVKNKIEELEKAQKFIKDGILDFLEESGEKKISFPDLASVSVAKTQPKVFYPENEEDLVEKLRKEKSEYVVAKYSLDKKSILKYYKETGDLPVDDLIGESEGVTVRVTVSKSRKSEK